MKFSSNFFILIFLFFGLNFIALNPMSPHTKDEDGLEDTHPAAKMVRAMLKAEKESNRRDKEKKETSKEAAASSHEESYFHRDTSPTQAPRTLSRRNLWVSNNNADEAGYFGY